MQTIFNLLRLSCGLSEKEAALFLKETPGTVKGWCSGPKDASAAAILELVRLSWRQKEASTNIIRTAKRKLQPGEITKIGLGPAMDDTDAQSIGWPFASAHHAVVRRVLESFTPPEKIGLVYFKPRKQKDVLVEGQNDPEKGRHILSTTVFDLMRQSCGLSENETALFLKQPIGAVKGWCSGRKDTPEAALVELARLAYRQRCDADAVILDLNKKSVKEEKRIADVSFGVVLDDAEAQGLGWPFASTHHAVTRRLLESLVPSLAVTAKLHPRTNRHVPAAAQDGQKYKH